MNDSASEIERLRAEVRALGFDLVEAERSIKRLQRQLREARAQERRLTTQLREMRESLSWKVTAVFRARGQRPDDERPRANK
jgi:septal ring factor EnvC (AmiA/AmiB activator)